MKASQIGLTALLLASGCSRHGPPSVPEPTYHGKKLSAWLYQNTVDTNGDIALSDPAKEAVLYLGTNALPWLVREFRVPDSQGQFGVRRGEHDAIERHRLALLAIELLGPEAVVAVTDIPPIFQELDNYNDGRYSAIAALTRMGPQAVPILVFALKHPDYNTRARAAEALGELQPRATNAVPALLVALQDPNARVRAGAAQALGNIHDQAETVVPALVQLFTNAPEFATHPPPQPGVVTDRLGKRKIVLIYRFSFQRTNPPPQRLVKSSSGGLFSRPKAMSVPMGSVPPRELYDNLLTVQVAVVEALGNYGPAAKDALPELRSYLRTPRTSPEGSDQEVTDRNVRSAIRAALPRIGGG